MSVFPRACTQYRATKRKRQGGAEWERDGEGASVEVLLVTTGRIINKPREQRGGAETQTRMSERKHATNQTRARATGNFSLESEEEGTGDHCFRARRPLLAKTSSASMTSTEVKTLHPAQYKAFAELWKSNEWPIGADMLTKIAPATPSEKHSRRHFFAIPDPSDKSNLQAGGATFLQGRVAGIGLILVQREHQRKGLGSKIFRRCLDAALEEEETKVVWLTATTAGAPVYRRMGFEDCGAVTLLSLKTGSRGRGFPNPEGHRFSHVAAKDTPAEAIKMFDDALVGGSRGDFMRDTNTHSILLYSGDRLIAWAGIILEDEVPTNIGPLIVESEDTPMAAILALVDEAATTYAPQSPKGLVMSMDHRFGSSETLELLQSESGGWTKVDFNLITMINFEKTGSREWYNEHFGPQRKRSGSVQLAYFGLGFS